MSQLARHGLQWVGALAALAVCTGSAKAETVVRPDCRPFVSATNAVRFETDLQRRWYTRFWTGACDRLPMCMPGSPNWNDVVGKLAARTPGAQRAALQPRICRLGQLIGLEWARDKKVQKISTRDLRAFNRTLDAAPDVAKGVEDVETKARSMIAAP